jgi:hypothetical protein
MTTELHMTVCQAPYTGEAKQRQDDAQRLTAEVAPEWCKMHYVMVKDDGGEIETSAGPRHLPFLKDLMDYAASRATSLDALIGFCNSDVILRRHFFDRLDNGAAKNAAALIRVVDIPSVARMDEIQHRFCAVSFDGLVMEKTMWERERSSVFDYVLGEPWWDGGMMFWAQKMGLGPVILQGSIYRTHPHVADTTPFEGLAEAYYIPDALHVKHESKWSCFGPTPELPHYDPAQDGYISALGMRNRTLCFAEKNR